VGGNKGHFDFDGKLNCGTCIGTDKSIECGWRKLALAMAIQKLGPSVSISVHEALQLEGLCGVQPPTTVKKQNSKRVVAPANQSVSIFVDGDRPQEAYRDGTERAPYRLLTEARDRAREVEGRTAVTVYLKGYFSLNEPLNLTSKDSGTSKSHPRSWESWPGEAPAVISGAPPLTGLQWDLDKQTGVWTAILPEGVGPFRSLYIQGVRYWPARYPNNPDPRRHLYPQGGLPLI
jgi:hypothetical protein